MNYLIALSRTNSFHLEQLWHNKSRGTRRFAFFPVAPEFLPKARWNMEQTCLEGWLFQKQRNVLGSFDPKTGKKTLSYLCVSTTATTTYHTNTLIADDWQCESNRILVENHVYPKARKKWIGVANKNSDFSEL